ncbi:T9SS type A sorting domain-containing protein [Rufibacter roseus]|uniref:T9SS type A sorting domain-containing protein n=1 Tax=Rufibacter roseus TaxID=1567108 RepID=A0ABW2DU21_9BACT|nr:T9SS type A sorting domain-containing protein [Rufibacter roseus]
MKQLTKTPFRSIIRSANFTLKNYIILVLTAGLVVFAFNANAQTTSLNCKLTSQCFEITYNSYIKNSNNTVTLNFSVKTNCASSLSYIAFQLPSGAKATNAKNSNSKFTYSVENSTLSPFNSIKFEAINAEGFKNGATDNFSYTITAAQFSQLSNILVEAKASTIVGRVTFLPQSCAPVPLKVAGPELMEAKSTVTYTIEKADETATYEWTAPAGWEIISGQGTKSITVKVGEQSGEIKVRNINNNSVGSLPVTSYSVLPPTLPVSLVSFTAINQGGKIVLSWVTSSERDNKEFVIERSNDGINYQPIGTVNGNGTTTTTQKYSFSDASTASGTVYYRIKQIDFDGAYENSKTISVKSIATPTTFKANAAYPNPFQSELSVTLSTALKSSVSISLYDLNGKLVKAETATALEGTNQYKLQNLETLAKGTYILKVNQDNQTSTQRVVKSN